MCCAYVLSVVGLLINLWVDGGWQAVGPAFNPPDQAVGPHAPSCRTHPAR